MLLRRGGGFLAPNPEYVGSLTASFADETAWNAAKPDLSTICSPGDLVIATASSSDNSIALSGLNWLNSFSDSDFPVRGRIYYGFFESGNSTISASNTADDISVVFSVFSGFSYVRDVFVNVTFLGAENPIVEGRNPPSVDPGIDYYYLSTIHVMGVSRDVVPGLVTGIDPNFTLAGQAQYDGTTRGSVTALAYALTPQGSSSPRNPDAFTFSSTTSTTYLASTILFG
jgi:hypothetical protein